MEDNNRLALEMIKYEPEFKEGGFVHTHIKQGKSDPLVAIKSAVDRMTDLYDCLLYTSPSPRDGLLSRMPSSA